MIRFATLALLIAALLTVAVAALPVVDPFSGTILAAIQWLVMLTTFGDKFVDMTFVLALAGLTLTIEGSLLVWRIGKMVYSLIARL